MEMKDLGFGLTAIQKIIQDMTFQIGAVFA